MNWMTWCDSLQAYLIIGVLLFAIGLLGFFRHRNLVGMLISGELVLAGASLNFMAFNRFIVPDPVAGQAFTLFIMGIAAAEAAVVLSIMIAVYRNYRSIETQGSERVGGVRDEVPATMTDPIQSYALLAAVAVPLIGAALVMLTGSRPNLREACSFAAAISTFGIIASLVPAVLAGQRFVLPLFTLLPGVSLTLRADSFSMVFALVASFLWIVTVLYSIGYMRGLDEHAQTRFNACFALALFGAIGCAFADNLFTLYLFYEIVSITTYPLVAHHQDEEGYEGGRKYLVYLTGTAKGLVLPAMILTYVMCGTLDFSDNIRTGIFPSDASRLMVTITYACLILGFAKNGVMPFHHWLPGAMVAPTPVSALLHAVAVVKVGVFSTMRVMLYVFGVDTMSCSQPGGAHGLFRFVHHPGGVPGGPEQGQPEGAAGLLHRQPALLHNPRRGTADPGRHRGRSGPYRQPRLCQDHPVLLCRRHLCRLAQEEHLRDERTGAGHAVHVRRLCGGLAQHDRCAARSRFRLQMVSPDRCPGCPSTGDHGGAAGQHPAERCLLRAGRLPGIFRFPNLRVKVRCQSGKRTGPADPVACLRPSCHWRLESGRSSSCS